MHVTTKKEYIVDTQKAIELNRKIIRIVTIIGIILTIILGWLVAKNDYFAIDGPFREVLPIPDG